MKVGLRRNTAVRFFAALLAAAGFAFSSCGNLGLDEKSFQNKVSSYFEEMTSNAAVGAYQLDPANAPTDKYGNFCFPYDQECKVTLLLRNPMRYRFDSHNMEFAMAGDNGVTHLPYYDDVGIEQDASDTSKIYITYPVSFLMNNPSGVNISPVVRLYHPVSHASFGVYDRLKLSSNAPPPSPSGALVVQTNESTGSKWVVCFKLLGSSEINNYHSDITSVSVNGNVFEPTITTGTISYPSGAALSSSVPSGITLAKNQVTGLDFTPESGTTQAQDAYFMTGDDVDQNQRVYTITVTDSAGLSSSVAVSARGFKLSAPDAYLVGDDTAFAKAAPDTAASAAKNTVGQDPNDGSAWVAIRAESKTAGGLTDGDGHTIDRYDYDPSNAYLVYELHRGTALNTSTLIRTGTLSGVSGKISIPAGTTYVKAFVRKPLYADSDPVVWNCRAVCTNLFVKESGVNDGGEGSKAKPYRTIQKAIDQFQNGITAGDYGENTQLNIRLLSDITPPESFPWSSNENSFAKVAFSGTVPAGLVVNLIGEGGRRTIDFNGVVNKSALIINGGIVNVDGVNFTKINADSPGSYVMNVVAGTVTYKNGSVYSNKGNYGGYINIGSGSLELRNVAFDSNSKSGGADAAALQVAPGAEANCYDCSFTGNKGVSRGTIVNSGTLYMEGCSITGGKSSSAGGGIFNASSLTLKNSSITSCVVSNDASWALNSGGAIYNEGSANLTNVTISGCSAGSDDSSGFGGAVFNSSGATATFTGCVIKGNTAAYGAAFYAVVPAAATQTVVFDSCSITGNQTSNANSAAVAFTSSSIIAGLKLKGKNTIYDNTIPGTTPGSTKQGNVLYYYLANENSTCKYPIIIDGNISESKIGINMVFYDAHKPSAAEPRKFTDGYGFDATNAKKPGLVFFAENGYGITDKDGEAAFAVSGGGMYDPTDFKITTALDGAMAKPNVAKTFNVTISAERRLDDGSFPSEHSPAVVANLVYNPTDHKLYEVGGTVPAAGEGSDNPAVTWTAALYNGGQKIASGASITANGLTVTIPAAAMPQPDTYILKITATYMGYTHDASFPITVRNMYGDKSAPTAVGDIVFSDGTATPYSDSLVLDANQKANAVAVIFYANGDDPYLGNRILGVGLKEGSNLMWAPSGTPGYSSVNSSSVSGVNHNDGNGSVNWGGVCNADSSATTNMAANYPAFNYANTYGVEISGEASGWYLPAYRGLQYLLDARDTVNNAIGKIGSPAVTMGTDWYWSSSLPNGLPEQARRGCASNNYDFKDKTNQHNVRAIRQF